MNVTTLSTKIMNEADIEKLCMGKRLIQASVRMPGNLADSVEQEWREKFQGLPFVMGSALVYFAARGVLSSSEARDSKKK